MRSRRSFFLLFFCLAFLPMLAVYRVGRLAAERRSEDPEAREEDQESPLLGVYIRPRKVLRWTRQSMAEQAFVKAMAGPWPDALKEGRLTGPLLGVKQMNAQPGKVGSLGSEPGFDTSIRQWGLNFLARAQGVDGGWSAQGSGAQIPADVDQTAFALLAFLGAGHTEKVGCHKQTVRNAVAWLRRRQRPDGAVLNESWTHIDGVSHALATSVLCEAAGMARRPETKAAAQRAVDFAVLQQDTETGGFARVEGGKPDLFTTAIYTLALKSAKVAGLKVPYEAFNGVIRFLDVVEDNDNETWRYVPDGKPAVRAEILGLCCRQMMGWRSQALKEKVAAALKSLGAPDAERGDEDVLFSYLATWLAYCQGGGIWQAWNKPLLEARIESQMRVTPFHGAWPSQGAWGGGGYVLSTSLSVLSMDFYFYYPALY